nr:zinc finger, CCHC-type [Tanacetum cinerariifolium]
SCTSKGIPLTLLWGRAPRLDSDVRVAAVAAPTPTLFNKVAAATPPSTLINKVTAPPPPPPALANKVAAPPPPLVVVNKVAAPLPPAVTNKVAAIGSKGQIQPNGPRPNKMARHISNLSLENGRRINFAQSPSSNLLYKQGASQEASSNSVKVGSKGQRFNGMIVSQPDLVPSKKPPVSPFNHLPSKPTLIKSPHVITNHVTGQSPPVSTMKPQPNHITARLSSPKPPPFIPNPISQTPPRSFASPLVPRPKPPTAVVNKVAAVAAPPPTLFNKVTAAAPPSTLINKVTAPPPPPLALANKVAAPPPPPVAVNKVVALLPPAVTNKVAAIGSKGQIQPNGAPFPKKAKTRSTSPLDLVYGDLCGPITPPTPFGKKYIFLLVDEYSRYMWVYLLNTKDQAFGTFKEYKKSIEKELRTTLKMLRTDRGGEFTSNEFMQYCKENGIARQLTAPYSQQQNRVVERRNRTIMSTNRCMMKATNMPQNFWAEAVRHAIYILNSVPKKALEDITPYEAIKQRKLNLETLKVFGCIAYAKVPSQHLTKLDDRSIKMNETWDWKVYKIEHTDDEHEWTDFIIGNSEVTNEHHDHEIQPTEKDNEFPNNDDDDYASPRNSPTHSQTRTKDHGVTYKHNGGNKIHGYNDSSYGVNTQEGKGTTGIIFYYKESPISWSTQKQATVALSSCESEFVASTAAATQALWLKRLLSKLTHSLEEKVTIQVDNKFAIALMKNPVFHGRSKHIDMKYHFIRECVEREDIQVDFVSGEYQNADILTKVLPKIKFLTIRQLIAPPLPVPKKKPPVPVKPPVKPPYPDTKYLSQILSVLKPDRFCGNDELKWLFDRKEGKKPQVEDPQHKDKKDKKDKHRDKNKDQEKSKSSTPDEKKIYWQFEGCNGEKLYHNNEQHKVKISSVSDKKQSLQFQNGGNKRSPMQFTGQKGELVRNRSRGGDPENNKFVQDLDRRIRDEEKGMGSHKFVGEGRKFSVNKVETQKMGGQQLITDGVVNFGGNSMVAGNPMAGGNLMGRNPMKMMINGEINGSTKIRINKEKGRIRRIKKDGKEEKSKEKSEQKKAERDKNKSIKKSDPVTVPNSLPAQSLETSFQGVGTEGINKLTTPPPPPSTLINKVMAPPPPPPALANKVAAPPPHPVVVNKVLDQLYGDDDLERLFNRKEGSGSQFDTAYPMDWIRCYVTMVMYMPNIGQNIVDNDDNLGWAITPSVSVVYCLDWLPVCLIAKFRSDFEVRHCYIELFAGCLLTRKTFNMRQYRKRELANCIKHGQAKAMVHMWFVQSWPIGRTIRHHLSKQRI